MEFDGKKQRNALTAAERSIEALAKGDSAGARRAAARATDLDQLGVYGALEEAVDEAADRLEAGMPVDDAWDAVHAAVGPGPLAGLVESVRG